MVKKRAQYHYSVRRLKRRTDLLRAEKLIEAAMQGDLHLLKEMKVLRGGGCNGQTELPDTVAGANGPEEVVEKFREVYSALYNSAGSESEMSDLMDTISKLIRPECSA